MSGEVIVEVSKGSEAKDPEYLAWSWQDLGLGYYLSHSAGRG